MKLLKHSFRNYVSGKNLPTFTVEGFVVDTKRKQRLISSILHADFSLGSTIVVVHVNGSKDSLFFRDYVSALDFIKLNVL